MLDLKSPFYTVRYNKGLFGGTPEKPATVIEGHLARTPPGAVVSAAVGPARNNLGIAIVQHGRLLEFLEKGTADGVNSGSDRNRRSRTSLFPEDRIQKGEGKSSRFPPTFLYQSRHPHPSQVNRSIAFCSGLILHTLIGYYLN